MCDQEHVEVPGEIIEYSCYRHAVCSEICIQFEGAKEGEVNRGVELDNNGITFAVRLR